jgi:hypothetical protein
VNDLDRSRQQVYDFSGRLIGANSMDSGFKNFIIGSILIVPFLFLMFYLIRKKVLKAEAPPKSMMDDPWDPNSDWNRHRRNKLPG